jgi:hypothetical protein
MDYDDRFNGLVECTSNEDIKEMETCRLVGDALTEAYRDHLWAVAFQGGAIVVKLMSVEGYYGMILDNAERYSASALKKHAIMSAGELLERSGQKRGKWDGQFHKYIDKA